MIRGTFLGIETAKRGIYAAQGALDTVSHNISNAGVEGYSRQRVDTASPQGLPQSGRFKYMYGVGPDITNVTRIRSSFIELQVNREKGSLGTLTTMEQGISQMEAVFNEPGNNGLNNLLESFFTSWEDLSNNPESAVQRNIVRQNGQAIVQQVSLINTKLTQQVSDINQEISLKLKSANNIGFEIQQLNDKIMRLEGGQVGIANDLRDERDRLVASLAKDFQVHATEAASGALMVDIGGYQFVQEKVVNEMRFNVNYDDPLRPQLEFDSRIPVALQEGEIKGLLRIRDEGIPAVQKDMATWVTGFVNNVNKIHIEGYSLDNQKGRSFFNDIKTKEIRGNVPLPATLKLGTTLDKLGISAGDFFVDGQRIVITENEVKPDTAITLGDLIDRVNNASTRVRMNYEAKPSTGGLPQITLGMYNPEEKNASIDLRKGNSNVLDVLGLDQKYELSYVQGENYTTVFNSFTLSPIILEDLNAIAAAQDDGTGNYGGPGDNRNSLLMAALKSKSNAIGEQTILGYYRNTIADLGIRGDETNRLMKAQTLVVEQVVNRRESVSGVSLDDEAVNMIKYQRAFEASSRMVSALDQVLDGIVNRLGTVGR